MTPSGRPAALDRVTCTLSPDHLADSCRGRDPAAQPGDHVASHPFAELQTTDGPPARARIGNVGQIGALDRGKRGVVLVSRAANSSEEAIDGAARSLRRGRRARRWRLLPFAATAASAAALEITNRSSPSFGERHRAISGPSSGSFEQAIAHQDLRASGDRGCGAAGGSGSGHAPCSTPASVRWVLSPHRARVSRKKCGNFDHSDGPGPPAC